MSKNTYEYLKDIAKGKSDFHRWENPDSLILDIDVNERNPITSKVILDFQSDDEFLQTLGLDEADVWNYKRVMYFEMSDYDYYNYQDDWKEGYILDSFSDENKEKYEKVVKLSLSPVITDRSKILKHISEIHQSEIDDIITTYAEENERCRADAAKEIVREETEKPFERFGIIEIWHGARFKTTIGVLLNWFKMLKAETEDVQGLLTKLFEKYGPSRSIGNWDDVMYNSFCDDYNQEYVQKEIGWYLDKILEKIEEEGIAPEFHKLYDVINKIGGFGKFIKLKDKDISVIFKNIDPQTGRIIVMVYKKDGEVEKRSVDNLEDLYLTLYQPELFESVESILKRIL